MAWAIFFLRLIHGFRNSFFVLAVVLAFSSAERAEALLAVPLNKPSFDFTEFTENSSVSFPIEATVHVDFRQVFRQANSVHAHSLSSARQSAAAGELQTFENELMCFRLIYQSV